MRTFAIIFVSVILAFVRAQPMNPQSAAQASGIAPNKLQEPPMYFRGFYNSSKEKSPRNPPVHFDLQVEYAVIQNLTTTPWPVDPAFEREKDLMNKERGCEIACLDHGHCDSVSHLCICENFWTQNPFRLYKNRYLTNCDWNVFVVIGVLIGIAFASMILAIICNFCCRRKEEVPYRRYRLLPEDDMEGFGTKGDGKRVPRRGAVRDHMVDSEDENDTVFEARNPKFYPAYSQGAVGKNAAAK